MVAVTPQHYSHCARELLKLASKPNPDAQRLYREVASKVPEGVTVVLDKNNRMLKRYGGGVYGVGDLVSKVLKAELPKGDVIVVSRQDPVTLAHEAGHAAFNESLVGRVLQSRVARGAAGLAGAGALAAGAAGGAKLGPLGGALLGASVPFLLSSPTLIGEAVASHKGVERLREAGMSEEQIDKAKKQLTDAFFTYAKQPLRAGAGGALVGGVAGWARS